MVELLATDACLRLGSAFSSLKDDCGEHHFIPAGETRNEILQYNLYPWRTRYVFASAGSVHPDIYITK